MKRDMIKVSAPFSLASEIPRRNQFAHDSLSPAFRDVQGGPNIAKSYARIPRNQKERSAMIREQSKVSF
jgi:hypothetical protein